MNKKVKQDLMKDCTEKMSINIDGIPKDVCIQIAEYIGTVLKKAEFKFDYGGIGEGFSGRICGIQFNIEQ